MKRHALLAVLLASALSGSGATLAADAAQADALPTVTVALTSPTSIAVSAGAQSGAVNVAATSTIKQSSVLLFQLNSGVTTAEVEAYFTAHPNIEDPNMVSRYGSIVLDVETNPGKPSQVQANLQPGQYMALGLGNGEHEGTPKARAAFTVTASASPAALPSAQATERTIDFGFRGPTVLHVGELVRFENEGFLVHMNIGIPVKNVKSANKLIALLKAGRERQAFKLLTGAPVTFAGPVSTGAYQQETITAKPGLYVQVCFMDTQDGRSHTRLGMERIIRIVK